MFTRGIARLRSRLWCSDETKTNTVAVVCGCPSLQHSQHPIASRTRDQVFQAVAAHDVVERVDRLVQRCRSLRYNKEEEDDE